MEFNEIWKGHININRMMIDKQNIFELLGNSTSKYHSAILTSYAFDPLYFNNLLLPNLKRRGISNIIVLLDASTYDVLLSDYEKYSNYLMRNDYTLFRQEPIGNGVFHPKIIMFFGTNDGMLLTGSGNLTYSGQSINEEVWGAINLNASETTNYPLLKEAWHYLQTIMPKNVSLITQQLNWIHNYSPWLDELDKVEDKYIIKDSGDHVRFIANNCDETLLLQVINLLNGETILSIDIVAPFYDKSGWLLQAFEKEFKPAQFTCWVYTGGTYPDNLDSYDKIQFILWKKTDILKDKLHAKIYQFRTANETFLLIGSANATRSAWGEKHKVFNDEAMLLLHSFNKCDYLTQLGISEFHVEMIENLENSVPAEHSFVCYPIKLTHAEIVNGFLRINVESKCKGNFVFLLDSKANLLQKFTDWDSMKIDEGIRQQISIAVISDGDNEISNRCLVIDEDVILIANPNPNGKKLVSLLNSSTDWDDNIANILQFVTFESNDMKSKIQKCATSRNTFKTEAIDVSEYSDIILKGRTAILSMDNIRIADFLCGALLKNSTVVVESKVSDQPLLEQEVESGKTNEGMCIDESNGTIETGEKERKAILRYLNKYNEQSSLLLSDLEEKFLSNQQELDLCTDYYPIILDKPTWNRGDGSLTDYSAALVAVALISNELLHSNISQVVAKDFLLTIIGRFLLLHGGHYVCNHDYSYIKKLRMHKDLAILAMLTFSQCKWYEKDQEIEMGKILLLNLMASFHDIENLDDVFSCFKDKISDGRYSPQPDSLAIIQKTSCLYKEFTRYDTKCFVTNIKEEWTHAIAWKKSLGFVLLYDFERNRGLESQTAWKWSYSLLTSGYIYDDESILVHKGDKIVLFESFPQK